MCVDVCVCFRIIVSYGFRIEIVLLNPRAVGFFVFVFIYVESLLTVYTLSDLE